MGIKIDDNGKNSQINFSSVAEIAKKWQISQRSVRNYCRQGRIPSAILKGKTWFVPISAVKPERKGSKDGVSQSSIKKTVSSKAEQIRDVIRYIKKFKNATVIIYIDDKIIDSPVFSSHISDIALMHEAGLKVLIFPAAKKRIDDVLLDAGITWKTQNEMRITSEEAIPLVKMAAFDVSNKVMTSLSGHGIAAVIGNWVRSRAVGIIDGTDFGYSGTIDRICIESVQKVLEQDFIPIFPCIGWSANGKPYNISSIQLATETAIELKAEKLFFLTPESDLNCDEFIVPIDLPLSPEGKIPALNMEELEVFIRANSQTEMTENKMLVSTLLECAKYACDNGVHRVHILDGSLDGVIPAEIFSGLGSGTMIYKEDYGGIRPMKIDDISRVLGVMRPFVEKGILLPRSEKMLADYCHDYIVYELDGGIRACAALIPYSEDGKAMSASHTEGKIASAEIAAIAVDETYSRMGIGPKLVEYLLEKSRSLGIKSVFVLTTQTADWFEQIGFEPDSVESLPKERRGLWSPQRGSKVFRLTL